MGRFAGHDSLFKLIWEPSYSAERLLRLSAFMTLPFCVAFCRALSNVLFLMWNEGGSE